MVLVLVMWPLINGEAPSRADIDDQLFLELWMWEISLLAVPLIVLARKRKDFVYDSVNSIA